MAKAGDRLGRIAGRWQQQRSHAAVEGAFVNLASSLEIVISQRPAPTESAADLALDGYASYGRYWAELLRLPTLSPDVLDQFFTHEGRDHLVATREAGFGPIVVLPHLGGWEWAAAWLTRVDKLPVTAAVELLEPPDVFQWFRDQREAFGVDVVPLGPDAFGRLTDAVKRRSIVCLLGDRVIDSRSVEVEFFGRPARLPIGPALLSRRTGAPIHVTAVYFSPEGGHHCVVGEPVWPDLTVPLRRSLAETTQEIARRFEPLIAAAPEQWHVLSPIWASERVG